MSRSYSLKTFFIALVVCIPLNTSLAVDAQDLQRLEERLASLEQEASALRSDLDIIKSQLSGNTPNGTTPNTNPLLGTWECTNNIFNYELSLLPDSTVFLKELSSNRTRQGKWLMVGKDIVISNPGYGGGGDAQSFRVVDLSDDRMTLEEPNTQRNYECDKLSQE